MATDQTTSWEIPSDREVLKEAILRLQEELMGLNLVQVVKTINYIKLIKQY